MKHFKKILALILAGTVVLLAFAGCSKSPETTKAQTGSVYWLNFKPEIAEQVKKAAQAFTSETGIPCTVKTAASSEYEQTLTSEMAKEQSPTLFNVNGPVGLKNWQDYCYDLTDSEVYNYLSDKGLALTSSDGKVYGIPNTVEAYGIIYNNAVMKKYFDSANKSTDYKSVTEITSFKALKEVTEDMTKLKDELNIDGVFASTSLSSGNQWRWQTHLANIPFYYEFKNKDSDKGTVYTGLNSEKVDFSYNENYKNLFDLYVDNSTTEKKLLGSKSVDDSMAEFALGKCAMVQNGNWAWNQINSTKGNVVKQEDIGFLPLYTGVDGEQSQGLCIGTENYFAVNSTADDEDIKATLEFMKWLFNTDTGKSYAVKEFGFIAPFTTFSDDEKPTDPLAKNVLEWMDKDDVTNIEWTFSSFPSETFKDEFGSELLRYVQGQAEWNQVVDTVKKAWTEQYKASQSA